MTDIKIAYDPLCMWADPNIDALSSMGTLIPVGEPGEYDAQILIKSPYRVVPLSHYPELRIVAANTTSPWHIDLEYCQTEGIEVITLEGHPVLGDIKSTAEHTCGLIHAAHRGIVQAHLGTIAKEEWDRYPYGAPKELSESTLLIIGFGRIGFWVAEMMEPCMKYIISYDPIHQGGINNLKADLACADIVALCCSLTESSHNILDADALWTLPRGSVVVNTAQGACLDTEALITAMEAGHIRAAALDVLEGEFTGAITPSMEAALSYASENPNLIITPHIAGSTETAWDKTQAAIVAELTERTEKWT